MNGFSLNNLQAEDIPEIISTFTFPWTTLENTQDKWKRYYEEQQKETRVVCIAKIENQIVSYGSLLLAPEYALFKYRNVPEIADVWVLEEKRKLGVGRAIIHYFEEMAKQANYKQIGIGVGLYKDYGNAQKLYVKLGYVPDGTGITYKCLPVMAGAQYPVDDDLVLWLKKDLI